jgi:hypothetical protein
MCISVIILPILATLIPDDAVKIGTIPLSKIFTAATAILTGIIAWSRLDVVSANFDKARSALQIALVRYQASPTTETEKTLQETLTQSEGLIRAFTPGIPQQGQPSLADQSRPPPGATAADHSQATPTLPKDSNSPPTSVSGNQSRGNP